jgi:hypothetical protein
VGSDYRPFKIEYNSGAHHAFQTFRAQLICYLNILPQPARVRLVPAEETAAEDVLRYAETVAQSDASFKLKHIRR